MVKKVISFIIILVTYGIIGAAVIIGTSNFGLGLSSEDRESSFSYAYALDRAGDIYYINDTASAKNLVSVDSSGKVLFEKKLSDVDFGDNFYVDSIYVEHDKSIYVVVYEYNPQTLVVENASVHMFLEDGSYYGDIFSEKVSVYSNGGTPIISAFSEDDTNVYFALLKEGKAEVFTALKSNAEPVSKLKEYIISETDIYDFYTTSKKEIVVGHPGGLSFYSDEITNFSGGENAIFDKFWNGINSFYVLDSASGDIYTVSRDSSGSLSASSVSATVSGNKIINAEEGVSTGQMSDIAVGITGNVFGTVRGETTRFYLGSFSVMSRVYTDDVDASAVLNSLLVLAAVIVAVVLLSVFTWDFYCSIMKMRLSILLRQSLLIALLMFATLYALSFLVVTPQVETIVTANYSHEAQLIGNSFENAMDGIASAEGDSYGAYENFLGVYGNAVADVGEENEYTGDDEKPQIHLVEKIKGYYKLIASSELLPMYYPADRILYDANFSGIVSSMNGVDTFFQSSDITGDKLYMIRKISLDVTENDTYLVVGTRISGLQTAVNDIQNTINVFLMLGGVVLIAIFMIIENITAGAVRKLKRSVDKIAAGQYDTPINVHTGDEIEELSISVKALSKHIIDTTSSLKKLNNSYYRFVPLSFLSTLGETRIERVGKSLQTKKTMTVLFLRFNFSQALTNMESADIFENINNVFEKVIPVINAHDGTAYNFLFNGFNAIFSESSENALQAAIKIREIVSAFNDVQRSQGKRTVDIRIVINRGEVLLGFIGDEKRMEPTAVSTAITEANEIEKLCVDSGLYIVCTDNVFAVLPKGKYRNRCIGKFKTSDGDIHKLYDMFDSDPYVLIKLKEQLMTRFELGVNLFEKKDFLNARTTFMDIVKYAADDGVSRNYMYLAEQNLTAENKQLTYTVNSELGR